MQENEEARLTTGVMPSLIKMRKSKTVGGKKDKNAKLDALNLRCSRDFHVNEQERTGHEVKSPAGDWA